LDFRLFVSGIQNPLTVEDQLFLFKIFYRPLCRRLDSAVQGGCTNCSSLATSLWRHKYVGKMKLFREEGKMLFTWMTRGLILHAALWEWLDKAVTPPQDAVLVGNMAGLQNPPGNGSSFVIACGSERGFIGGSESVIGCTKKIPA